ncbi:hypothetical protein REPUB_Repub04eG0055400 [Reevesia pubescens]
MADLRDLHGNPIELTDEHGNTVQLTDEYGNPVHVTGVATKHPAMTQTGTLGGQMGYETGSAAEYQQQQQHHPQRMHYDQVSNRQEIRRSNSSSSSEDDGMGGRRKKKGLKEKLTGGKHKEEDHAAKTTSTTATLPPGQQYHPEKKSVMEKIKEKLSGPVTIADQAAGEAMVSKIWENFPSHAICGEEKGWRCKEKSADYVWVLDPIDGTLSFITGKPVFGTLIALLHKGKPVSGQ